MSKLRILQTAVVALFWALALSNWCVPGFSHYWGLGQLSALPSIGTTDPATGG